MKRPLGSIAEAFATAAEDYAETIAAQLGARVLRIVVTRWKESPTPPLDAVVTIWPKDGAVLPDDIGAPRGVEICHALDVESYCTIWCD